MVLYHWFNSRGEYFFLWFCLLVFGTNNDFIFMTSVFIFRCTKSNVHEIIIRSVVRVILCMVEQGKRTFEQVENNGSNKSKTIAVLRIVVYCRQRPAVIIFIKYYYGMILQ